MNRSIDEIDVLIREALGQDDAELLDQFGPQSLPEMITDAFRGRRRLETTPVTVVNFIFFGLSQIMFNQFGFDRRSCGIRMPEDMKFRDIRMGSDVEFGQSIYEPFGIAQVEALSFGSICVMSSVCGCRFFASKAAGPGGSPNVIVADYTAYKAHPDTIDGYRNVKREEREAFGHEVAEQVARQILDRLPRTREEKAAFIRRGYDLARQMSWDVVARDYFLPAMHEITSACSPSEAIV